MAKRVADLLVDGTKRRRLTIRHRVRRLRKPTASFPAPFERISDPQIPLTRLVHCANLAST
jgi:hypothetical protein